MPTTIDIDVPDLAGSLAVVTGASDGVGLQIARRLAVAGADLVLPVRNPEKGAAAAGAIRGAAPGASVELVAMDLASLASVASAVDGLVRDGRPVDLLINNAGIMTPPTRQRSEDGFELQLAVNHLGHVALVAGLLPLLRAGTGRVATQISVAASRGSVHWDDLNWDRSYDAMAAYRSSKVALGLFAVELHRRSEQEGWGLRSTLAHPGISPTNLLAAQPGMGRPKETAGRRIIGLLSRAGVLVGTPASAALPAVLAATAPDVAGGALIGPSGPGHLGGRPAEQSLFGPLTSPEEARRVWDRSLELCGATIDA